jgi:hypothetical protein
MGAMLGVRQRIRGEVDIMPEVGIYVVNADPATLAYNASLGVSFGR